MAAYDKEGLQTGRSEPHYTVFIRLPFARGDFVDPPPVSLKNLPHQSMCTDDS